MAVHPLSDAITPAPEPVAGTTATTTTLTLPPPDKPRRTPAAPSTSRRDTLKHRNALLRGAEGTRRRRRWENDRLLSNPHAVPPSAADWEPRPLYPVRTIPYEYAALFTPGTSSATTTTSQHHAVPKVPTDLKARLKRSRGSIALLRTLEDDVRAFLAALTEQQQKEEEEEEGEDGMVKVNIEDVVDHSGGEGEGGLGAEEEIVFVSKRMRYALRRRESMRTYCEERRRERVVFESGVEEESGGFGRWMVHCIATYYGLRSWSVTRGDPQRRLAYVGLKKDGEGGLPKPLYLML